MGILRTLFPTCKEVAERLARDGRPSWAARLHLLHCRLCERYARQLRLLAEAWRSALPAADPAFKKRLLDRLNRD